MDEQPDPRVDGAEERRFSLSVWPRTPDRPWHAEISVVGSTTPVRFDRAVDLVLFLTELSRSPNWQPRGLR